MKERTKLALLIGGILLLVVGAVSISYAFLSVTKKQTQANTFTSGCLNISIENESNAITLNNTYPITDLQGLENEGYTFTIKNTCNTSANYQINLESLNQTSNTLDTEYLKTSLSSDTMDNLIQKLDSSMVTKAYIENAYVSHNLYKGSIAGNSTKEFNLKIWIDYDTTKEQGANKTYISKINVIANPDLEVENAPEIKTALVDNKLEGTITGEATTAKYCTSENNICIPNISTTITDNNISIERPKATNIVKEVVATSLGNIEVNSTKDKRIICSALNNNKTYCSNSINVILEPDFSQIAVTDEGIYSVADPMYNGISYYWRGAVTNNYVRFAGFCWRIIRINGDGSIRLIYDGTTCHANGEITTDSIAVHNVQYNTSGDSSSHVGWTFKVGYQRPSSQGAESVVEQESNAKIELERWFSANIAEEDLKKIADGKFCNDRRTKNNEEWRPTGESQFYAAYQRLQINKSPILECLKEDTYTLKVGLITADEVSFAGGVYPAQNSLYYLDNGQCYWTMSPYDWYNNLTRSGTFNADWYASLNNDHVGETYGIRPVINLRSDVTFNSGSDGTQNNPYVVS